MHQDIFAFTLLEKKYSDKSYNLMQIEVVDDFLRNDPSVDVHLMYIVGHSSRIAPTLCLSNPRANQIPTIQHLRNQMTRFITAISDLN